ncbi:SDR family NAD(P)-dependent oxidoreductase [Hydrogenophaga crocea]|uniref:SDR family oxidoreductase n=1 Tax=Hydrogenophaga crocea TaxID=2716225 RepID=A0A6G8IDW7_9BURK|nr:SDR family NAD(P)-dependent oxidoreductase [Hydrogenophaga crocea]QIM51309.1 SDR family oxidoreductase [Hydrogenophaga crocea]
MDNPKQHQQRVALITGAASGIGLQIAHDLAEQGAMVCIVDRNGPAAEAAAQAITAAGGRAQAFVFDLADAQALAAGMDALLARVGQVDILVNNAGIVSTTPARDVTLAQWNTTLAVNVTAPMLLTQRVLPAMQAQRWGRIVNVSSISGVRAGTGRLAYGSSKAALIAMTGQFAIEVAAQGVTVNAIAPGFVDTPMLRSLHGSSKASTYQDVCPMQRFCSPQEVSAAVLFFCSEAAAFITGQTLGVDGGYLASGLFMPKLFDIPAAAPVS